jgi:flagellar assembly protein FliH
MGSKFLFETNFDRRSAPKPKAEKPVHTETALAQVREDAFAEGANAGLEQGRNEQTARLAEAVERISEAMVGLGATQTQAMTETRQAAANLALAIAARLAPMLVARAPLVELEVLIADCLADLTSEPRVVVRVASDLVEALSERIDALKQSAAFPGQVIVLGDEGMAPGDGRVEWADGGAERDLGGLIRAIEERVNRAAALL